MQASAVSEFAVARDILWKMTPPRQPTVLKICYFFPTSDMAAKTFNR